MTDSPTRSARQDGPDAIWPADPGALDTATGDPSAVKETDGRRLRRALNREAVVDALLDLYSEGNLRPSTDEIAERAGISPRSLFRYFEDADDLAGEAVARQLGRAMPLLPLAVGPDAPFDIRVAALVDQRLRLFITLGQAAHVSRLRAPFQPRLAKSLREGRRFLRSQVRTLFAPGSGTWKTRTSINNESTGTPLVSEVLRYACSTFRRRLTIANDKRVTGEVMRPALSLLLNGPVFDSIRTDKDQFRQVRVEDRSLVWPGGVDLCPDVVI